MHIPCLLCLHFSSLLSASTEFGISLTQVNWLANSVNLIYLPSSIAIPLVAQRWGIRSAVGRDSLSFRLSFSPFGIVHSRRSLFIPRFLDSLCRSVRHGPLERRELCPLDNWSGKSAVFGDSSLSLGYPQLLAGVAQPVYQVLGPKYSETWFSLKGRTTATMLLAVGMYSRSFHLNIRLRESSSEPDRRRHRSTYPPLHFYPKTIGI